MERQVSGSLLACLAITLSTAGFGYADEPEIRAFAPLPEIATVVPKDNPQTYEKV